MNFTSLKYSISYTESMKDIGNIMANNTNKWTSNSEKSVQTITLNLNNPDRIDQIRIGNLNVPQITIKIYDYQNSKKYERTINFIKEEDFIDDKDYDSIKIISFDEQIKAKKVEIILENPYHKIRLIYFTLQFILLEKLLPQSSMSNQKPSQNQEYTPNKNISNRIFTPNNTLNNFDKSKDYNRNIGLNVNQYAEKEGNNLKERANKINNKLQVPEGGGGYNSSNKTRSPSPNNQYYSTKDKQNAGQKVLPEKSFDNLLKKKEQPKNVDPRQTTLKTNNFDQELEKAIQISIREKEEEDKIRKAIELSKQDEEEKKRKEQQQRDNLKREIKSAVFSKNNPPNNNQQGQRQNQKELSEEDQIKQALELSKKDMEERKKMEIQEKEEMQFVLQNSVKKDFRQQNISENNIGENKQQFNQINNQDNNKQFEKLNKSLNILQNNNFNTYPQRDQDIEQNKKIMNNQGQLNFQKNNSNDNNNNNNNNNKNTNQSYIENKLSQYEQKEKIRQNLLKKRDKSMEVETIKQDQNAEIARLDQNKFTNYITQSKYPDIKNNPILNSKRDNPAPQNIWNSNKNKNNNASMDVEIEIISDTEIQSPKPKNNFFNNNNNNNKNNNVSQNNKPFNHIKLESHMLSERILKQQREQEQTRNKPSQYYLFENSLKHILRGKHITVSGFENEDRNKIKQLISELGGIYEQDLSEICNYMIAKDRKTDKYNQYMQNRQLLQNLKIVSNRFLVICKATKKIADHQDYPVY